MSLGAQTERVRAYSSLYDLELVEIVEDAGVSAKTLERPELQRVLAALRKGEVQGLVVAKLDIAAAHEQVLTHDNAFPTGLAAESKAEERVNTLTQRIV